MKVNVTTDSGEGKVGLGCGLVGNTEGRLDQQILEVFSNLSGSMFIISPCTRNGNDDHIFITVSVLV